MEGCWGRPVLCSWLIYVEVDVADRRGHGQWKGREWGGTAAAARATRTHHVGVVRINIVRGVLVDGPRAKAPVPSWALWRGTG